MVLVVLADSGQMLHQLNSMAVQFLFRSDSGLQQDLRCVDCAKRENHFPAGKISASRGILYDFHADDRLFLKDEPADHR